MTNWIGICRQALGHSVPPATRTSRLWTGVLAATLAAAVIAPSAAQTSSSASPAETASACATPADWIDLKTGQSIDRGQLFGDLVAKSSVVLLGESHTDADHHRWQLQTVAALHGRGGNMVIGFESFPRRLQAVLDDWVDGKLTDEAFLKASEWRQVWGYDAAFYMPLFQFARLNRIPMIALNVDQKLVARVGQQGWENVPASEREGLSDPAPASPAYQRELAHVYLIKKAIPPGADPFSSSQGPSVAEPDDAAVEEAVKQPEFKRFVEAQLTWDRAMAEALASAKRKFSNATIVGILGSGHVEGGYGVPHQLRDLGITQVMSLLPVPTDAACMLVGTSFADAVFTLPATPADETSHAERPRLGVALVEGDGAPRINRVVDKSVAEIAGLKVGDEVVRAAGLTIRKPDELVEVIARQAPGTWLPLSVRRDGQDIDLIAKFPTSPRPDR
jgi:uncharacterized iron-regulated protein